MERKMIYFIDTVTLSVNQCDFVASATKEVTRP
jgi:hypothetical protein